MKLNEYQTGAVSTAIYPGKLAYPTLGLCGEVGELVDACTNGKDEDVPKEIGDVLWYIANVSNDTDTELSSICKRKTFQNGSELFVFWDAAEVGAEMCVQAGIVAENVKKTIRDNEGNLQPKRLKNIVGALKRLMEALSEVANCYDTTLEVCAKMNLAKLQSRQERGKLKGDGNDR